jgi:hypothetical protein
MATEKVSRESIIKYRDFGGLIATHTKVVKGIYARYGSRQPYVYVDMNAGIPMVEFEGREYANCGVQAAHAVAELFNSFHLYFIDQNEEKVAQFRARLAHLNGQATFIAGDHTDYSSTLATIVPQVSRSTYGLVFHDPYGIPSYATLKTLFDSPNFQRVDLLIYCQVTAEKRARGAFGAEGYFHLEDALTHINKKEWLIREPHGRQQWTFIIGTNWADYPVWTQHGFYKVTSRRGQLILERLTQTNEARQSKHGVQIPFERPSPYSSYEEYLQHPEYRKVRQQAVDRSGGTCERCKGRRFTEVHHLRYPPWGTFDVVENLIAICHQCHCELHGKAN